MHACTMTGFHFAIAAPSGFALPADEQQRGRDFAKASGASFRATNVPAEALDGADVVYADTFVSMGQEEEKASRANAFRGFQVNAQLMAKAKPGALFMHCLPAHRGEEVTDDVMDSPQSIVFDQAECRLHVAKALLALYLT